MRKLSLHIFQKHIKVVLYTNDLKKNLFKKYIHRFSFVKLILTDFLFKDMLNIFSIKNV